MNQSEEKIPGAQKNLPLVLTSFIGRKRELAELKNLLVSSRLVTLTGAAGCGKTRLALHVARQAQHADGVCWVELARLEDPALAPQTVAKTLGVPQQAKRPALETLVKALQERELLLVLDNCEHLLKPCRDLTARILAETAVTVLATSREPLGVSGERLYPVSPLATPPVSHPSDDADGIAQYDAVQLFIERARATVPAFELTAGNTGTIGAICRSLAGIPLALELASARLNVLTAEQIAARLDKQFDLLPSATTLTYSHHDTFNFGRYGTTRRKHWRGWSGCWIGRTKRRRRSSGPMPWPTPHSWPGSGAIREHKRNMATEPRSWPRLWAKRASRLAPGRRRLRPMRTAGLVHYLPARLPLPGPSLRKLTVRAQRATTRLSTNSTNASFSYTGTPVRDMNWVWP